MSAVGILLILFFTLILRILFVLKCIYKSRRLELCHLNTSKRYDMVKCIFVAGSGGHTSELIRLVGALRFEKFCPRYYVVAATDHISEEKISSLENSKASSKTDFHISSIVRSREVGQSWISTVFTTLRASLQAFPLVFRIRPDLVLVNGPGTCIPICAAAFILTLLGHKVTIVFVESICRVTSMSLSGRVLYPFADQIVVQWPELHERYPRTRYMGRIV